MAIAAERTSVSHKPRVEGIPHLAFGIEILLPISGSPFFGRVESIGPAHKGTDEDTAVLTLTETQETKVHGCQL